MPMQNMLAPLVFLACYGLFIALPTRRSFVACGGALVLGLTGSLGWHAIFFEHINWNVIGLFFGTLVLSELFMQSRMPGVMAEYLVDRCRTLRGAMLVVCALGGFLSIFLENVAVVLLVSPIALSLAQKLKVSPVSLLIGVTLCANLEGTATLIGDPPSMIMAGYMKMSFNDFFFYHGRPSIFFAIQLGMAAGLLLLAWLFRRHREPIGLIPVEKVRSAVPTVFIMLLVAGLSTTSVFDPDFRWLAGTLTLVLAAVALIWFRLVARWSSARALIRTLDWDTTFFLIGVFVVVGALTESGWLDRMATWLSGACGGSLMAAYVGIVLVSVLVSGFVDNVPFMLAMIPVAQRLADQLHAPVTVLIFGLLVGACLGGNITPIGASANVVTIGILRKQGHPVSFGTFMRLGVPFTIVATTCGAVFVWLVWAR